MSDVAGIHGTVDAGSTVDATPRGGETAARGRVAVWLGVCAAMVFAMAVIGAITRLTESGLSMVEWRPLIGTIPPLTEAEWHRVFDLYRQTPEYIHKNAGMTLAQFKEIFFWEWFHRIWGRAIGLVFAVPLLAYWLGGTLRRADPTGRLRWKLLGMLVLGALQGLMGWYMVQSGLIDRPAVSQYRLAAHLGLAFLIYALLIWLILDLVGPRGTAGLATAPRGLRGHAVGTAAIVVVTIFWGAMVAGLDAGIGYNSWPLMDGLVLPPEALMTEPPFVTGAEPVPVWLLPFENPGLVQFVHRWIAIVAAAAVLALAWRAWRHAAPGGERWLLSGLGAAVIGQVLLGIATLVLFVPIPLAAAHQAGAFVLVGGLVAVLHRLRAADRPPSP